MTIHPSSFLFSCSMAFMSTTFIAYVHACYPFYIHYIPFDCQAAADILQSLNASILYFFMPSLPFSNFHIHFLQFVFSTAPHIYYRHHNYSITSHLCSTAAGSILFSSIPASQLIRLTPCLYSLPFTNYICSSIAFHQRGILVFSRSLVSSLLGTKALHYEAVQRQHKLILK